MRTSPDEIQIRSAAFPDDRGIVDSLFREYATSLGIDLSFQDFDEELPEVVAFYQKLGYSVEERISMERRLYDSLRE